MADNGQSETQAWVASKTVDGEWHRARVVSQQDGQATLVTLDTEETHTVPSDVSCPYFTLKFYPAMALAMRRCRTQRLTHPPLRSSAFLFRAHRDAELAAHQRAA
jgi:hypothetical protein